MNTRKRDAIRAASAASLPADPEEYARARDRDKARSAIEVLASLQTDRLAEVVAQLKKSKAKGAAESYLVSAASLDAMVELRNENNAVASDQAAD